MRKRSLCLASFCLLFLSLSHAAEKRPWKADYVSRGNITLFTHEGVKHVGGQLRLLADEAELYDADGKKELIPRPEVERILVSEKVDKTRYLDIIASSAVFPIVVGEFPCMDDPKAKWVACVPFVILLSPEWAFTVVSAPYFLAAEAISAMRPHRRLYEIVP